MRAQTWDLSSETVTQRFLAHIGTLRLSGKRPVVEILPERRNLNQNQMFYALYQQIGQQVDDKSIKDIRRECKLIYGVPILSAANPEFCIFFDKALGRLTYEEQLHAMDFVPVTSLMSKAQATGFIDQVIREYSQQGLCLLHPSEMQA